MKLNQLNNCGCDHRNIYMSLKNEWLKQNEKKNVSTKCNVIINTAIQFSTEVIPVYC